MDIKAFLNPVLIWFLVGLVMLLLELTAPGLVIFFFGVGAWIVALVCAFVPISLNAQLFLFILGSVLALVVLRRRLKTVFHGHVTDQQNLEVNLDDFVGHKALVKKAIVKGGVGQVEFKGTLWEAEGEDDIETDSRVEIVSKDNLTLKVRKIQTD